MKEGQFGQKVEGIEGRAIWTKSTVGVFWITHEI
jgi:hypothetical protein